MVESFKLPTSATPTITQINALLRDVLFLIIIPFIGSRKVFLV
jgi:hypothetical protein